MKCHPAEVNTITMIQSNHLVMDSITNIQLTASKLFPKSTIILEILAVIDSLVIHYLALSSLIATFSIDSMFITIIAKCDQVSDTS